MKKEEILNDYPPLVQMRVVQKDVGEQPQIQYRFNIPAVDASGALCPSSYYSKWETAPWVTTEEEGV